MAGIIPDETPVATHGYSQSLVDCVGRSLGVVFPGQAIPPGVITALLDVFINFISQCLGMQPTAQAAQAREQYMRTELRSGSRHGRRWMRKLVNRSEQYRGYKRRDRKLIADQFHLDVQTMPEENFDELFLQAKARVR